MSREWPDIPLMHELEVWCASTRRWVGGFWFDSFEPDGTVRIRRGIDLQVLPGAFPVERLRAAPRRRDRAAP